MTLTSTAPIPLDPDHPTDVRDVPPMLQTCLALASLGIALWAFLQCWNLGELFIHDESQVFYQVQLFLQHRFELFRWPDSAYPAAATLPGFPALLALVAAATGQSSPAALRLYCFAFSLVYAALLYATARTLLTPRRALLRATQAFLLPVIFPFAALLATLRRAHVTAGLLMLLSMATRQTNVIFLLFLLALAYAHSPTRRRPADFARRFWPYLLGLAAFAAFLLTHGRVALDDPRQQSSALSPGNLLFSLVIGAMLLWPVLFARPRATLEWTRARWRTALLIAVVVAAVSFTYTPAHPWNRITSLLRNQLWIHFLADPAHRAALALLVSATLVAILSRRPPAPYGPLLAAFWLLSLAPIPLIEPRYHFPALLLYQLLRRQESPAAETLLWCTLAAGSLTLTHTMTTTIYIP